MKTVKRLTVYSAFVPALPLREASEQFHIRTGTEVTVKAGRPEQWMPKLSAGEPADLICCGAEFLLDIAERENLLDPGTRCSVGRRRSSLIVPRGNPASLSGLEDLTRSGIRLGIAVEGCTLGLWDEISSRALLTEKIRSNITARARGCGALLGIISRGEVDAAFGWTNMGRGPEASVEIVTLPGDMEILRSTGVAVAVNAKEPDCAKDFIDWLNTPDARTIYEKWGWETESLKY